MNILNHFSRITTSGRAFIPQIDGLRFIAIMAVVAYHVRASSYHFHAFPMGKVVEGGLVNDVFSVGNLGVTLFFAISGFVVALPFARQWLSAGERVSLREYYVRRLTRMQPPYVIHLAFLFAVCALVLRYQPSHPHLYHNAAWAGYALKHILASLFYVNGFIYAAHPYPNIVLWALEVEVQFYLLAPFLVRIFRVRSTRKRRGFLACLILLLPIASHFLTRICTEWYWVVFSLAGNLQYFLVGFLLVDLYLAGLPAPGVRNFKWDLLFLLAGAGVVFFRHIFWLEYVLPVIILISCLAAFHGTVTSRVLGNPWGTTIGGMCYTIYMYHWLMISLLVLLTGRWQTHVLWLDLLIQFVLMSAIIVVVCALLYVLFERPFMRRNWPSACWVWLRPVPKATNVRGNLPPG